MYYLKSNFVYFKAKFLCAWECVSAAAAASSKDRHEKVLQDGKAFETFLFWAAVAVVANKWI